MEQESKAGTWGWIAIGALAVGWDMVAPETISHAYGRSRENPLARTAVILGTAAIVGHLVGAIPERYDLLHRAFEYVPHNAEK